MCMTLMKSKAKVSSQNGDKKEPKKDIKPGSSIELKLIKQMFIKIQQNTNSWFVAMYLLMKKGILNLQLYLRNKNFDSTSVKSTLRFYGG